MFDPIPDPISGKSILPWAVPVTRALNAIGDKVGATARNERDRRGSASPDMGCWKIAYASRSFTTTDATTGGTTTTTEVYPTLINRYYSVGEIAAHMDEDAEIDLSDFILQGELSEGQAYTADDKPYICLEVLARPPEPEGGNESVRIVAYKDWSELVEAQRDLSVVVKPLYKLSHYGTIVVDYRNMPQMQMTEVV